MGYSPWGHKQLDMTEHSEESEVAQSCPTLCDPVDYSPPGSSAHGVLQAKILEWVAISMSRGSSQYRDQIESWSPALQADSLLLSHWGNPLPPKKISLPDKTVFSHHSKDSCPGNGHVNQGRSRYLLLQASYLTNLQLKVQTITD